MDIPFEDLRVLVVDDAIINWIHPGLPKDEDIEGWKSLRETFTARARKARSAHTLHDLTRHYRAQGGKARSLRAVAEPVLCGWELDRYPHAPLSEDERKSYFDMERAARIARETDHDVLLLDVNIPCIPTNGQLRHYRACLEEKLQDPVRLTVSGFAGRQYALDYPRFSSLDEFDAVHSGESHSEKHLKHAGGVLLAQRLAHDGVPFALWTSDYGYGEEGIAHLYTLGLLEKEDMLHMTGEGDFTVSRTGRITCSPKSDFLYSHPGNPARSQGLDMVIGEALRYLKGQ